MKKLLLVIVLMAGIFTAQAQRPSMVIYQVDSDAGYSNGLNLPNPFYFHVDVLTANVKDSTGLNLYSHTYSSTTPLDFTSKLANDSIAKMTAYFMTIPVVDTLTIDGMVEMFIKQELEDKFGSGNISKLE